MVDGSDSVLKVGRDLLLEECEGGEGERERKKEKKVEGVNELRVGLRARERSERVRRKEKIKKKTRLLDPVPVDRRLRAQQVDELDDDAVPCVGVDRGARVLAVVEHGIDLEAVRSRLRMIV